jgi:hypothetical protein
MCKAHGTVSATLIEKMYVHIHTCLRHMIKLSVSMIVLCNHPDPVVTVNSVHALRTLSVCLAYSHKSLRTCPCCECTCVCTDEGQGERYTCLLPVKGAIIKVRLTDERGEIEWHDAKLTKYIKETGEWKIKLDVCDGSSRRKPRIMSPEESQGQCRGCSECVFQLAPNDRGW